MLTITETALPEVFVIEPTVFGDERGFLVVTYIAQEFSDKTGVTVPFVQDNQSKSAKHVLRGLHYQIQKPQGKLVRVLCGRIIDVAVDVRKDSPNLGKWVSYELSAANKRQLWVPPGFAHGFYVLEDNTEVLYKTTDYYAPKHERTLQWNDPDLNIDWGLVGKPVLSDRDQVGTPFREVELYATSPTYRSA
ncbi:MAG: dTDP-4-dehydrorhamnose 3,5-epimerase [Cyanobacteria bacterium P01_H01_bin.15]